MHFLLELLTWAVLAAPQIIATAVSWDEDVFLAVDGRSVPNSGQNDFIVSFTESETYNSRFGSSGRVYLSTLPQTVRIRDLGVDKWGRVYVLANFESKESKEVVEIKTAPGELIQAAIFNAKYERNGFVVVRLLPNGMPDLSYSQKGFAEFFSTRSVEDRGLAMAVSPLGEVAVILGETSFLRDGEKWILRLRTDGQLEKRFGRAGRLAMGWLDGFSNLWEMNPYRNARLCSMSLDEKGRIQLGVSFSAQPLQTAYAAGIAISPLGQRVKKLNVHAPFIGSADEAEGTSVLISESGNRLYLASNDEGNRMTLEAFHLPSGYRDEGFTPQLPTEVIFGVGSAVEKSLRVGPHGSVVIVGTSLEDPGVLKVGGVNSSTSRMSFCHALALRLIQ